MLKVVFPGEVREAAFRSFAGCAIRGISRAALDVAEEMKDEEPLSILEKCWHI